MSGTTTVTALAAGGGNNKIQVLFKNCAPFTDPISKISNTQIDNAKDIGLVMLSIAMFIQKTGSLW